MKKITTAEFTNQMERMFEQFGSKAFSSERNQLILREVSSLTAFQFKKIVDDFLMGSKFAPLPKDFRDAATIPKRENNAALKKESDEAMGGMFDTKELKIISKALQQGLNGNNKALDQIINNLNPKRRSECKHCNDSGLVFAATIGKPWYADTVFNCFCKKSQNNKNYGVWGQRFMHELENKNTRHRSG